MGRLTKGKGRKLSSVFGTDNYKSEADELHVWQHGSMGEALSQARLTWLKYWTDEAKANYFRLALAPLALNADADRLAQSLEHSERLIEEAIADDPRLARRSSWRRGEEGEIACPALIAQGDDAPYFHRHRTEMSQANGCDPIRVVISTDSNKVEPDTAAAFIATVRIVQQFRPVEIWWQGAWLNNAGTAGWVFHVPLVQGDTDFARLEYCIADQTRDSLSWCVMIARNAQNTRAGWGECQGTATYSYLEGGPSHFVKHTGIKPVGWNIALRACEWLGWETMPEWAQQKAEESAAQKLPEIVKPYVYDAKAGEEYMERERQRRLVESQSRAASLARNF